MPRFPTGLRPSTLEERKMFYQREFDVRALSTWLRGRERGTKLAMILGRHTGIVAPAHAANKDDVILIDDWMDARDVKAYAIDYLPEGLYYDRNRYFDVRECSKCGQDTKECRGCYNYDGQQLAFDLDPENVDCPYHGHIGKKMAKGSGLSFCMYEFKAVRKQAAELAGELGGRYEEVGIVFSGRGFHVVVDDESAYHLTRSERKEVARRLARRYAIDEWVTEGRSRLMRLPLSLNAIVSRKCMMIKDVIDLKEFDPRFSERAIPRFARSSGP